MIGKDELHTFESEIEEGMGLEKCRHCGCMRDALEGMRSSLSSLSETHLLGKIESLLSKTEETAYA